MLEKGPRVGYEVFIKPKGLKRIHSKKAGGNSNTQSGKVRMLDKTLANKAERESSSDMNPPGTINIELRPMPEVASRFKGQRRL